VVSICSSVDVHHTLVGVVHATPAQQHAKVWVDRIASIRRTRRAARFLRERRWRLCRCQRRCCWRSMIVWSGVCRKTKYHVLQKAMCLHQTHVSKTQAILKHSVGKGHTKSSTRTVGLWSSLSDAFEFVHRRHNGLMPHDTARSWWSLWQNGSHRFSVVPSLCQSSCKLEERESTSLDAVMGEWPWADLCADVDGGRLWTPRSHRHEINVSPQDVNVALCHSCKQPLHTPISPVARRMSRRGRSRRGSSSG
jgi:hypothetical protein